jgi:hypothetical protein
MSSGAGDAHARHMGKVETFNPRENQRSAFSVSEYYLMLLYVESK